MTNSRLRMSLGVAFVSLLFASPPLAGESTLAARVKQLTRTTVWTRVEAIPVAFPTFHPQGMVKIGEAFFVTAVDKPRSAGHLFKIDSTGALAGDLPLGDGAIYHPGGIDYDGTDIWVPVAEYRPDSRAIVYRVDPRTMKATEVFRFADHIGAIVHDTDARALYGVSWGSRRFYRWPLDADRRVVDLPRAQSKGPGAPSALARLNPSHYVDYQDCHYAGDHLMLCGGVTEIRQAAPAAPFRLGGIELVDLAGGRPVHQVPVLVWTASGRVMTENPLWIEPSAAGLRGYFIPEDDRSTIYVYDLKSISSP